MIYLNTDSKKIIKAYNERFKHDRLKFHIEEYNVRI